jgi:hypothetical protein
MTHVYPNFSSRSGEEVSLSLSLSLSLCLHFSQVSVVNPRLWAEFSCWINFNPRTIPRHRTTLLAGTPCKNVASNIMNFTAEDVSNQRQDWCCGLRDKIDYAIERSSLLESTPVPYFGGPETCCTGWSLAWLSLSVLMILAQIETILAQTETKIFPFTIN